MYLPPICPREKAICLSFVVYCSTPSRPPQGQSPCQLCRFLPIRPCRFCVFSPIFRRGGCLLPENRHLRFLLRLLYAALALAGLWLALRFLLPWLLPFLLAFSLAALLEPAVRLLMERLHLPRAGRRRTVYRGSHRRCSGRAGAGGMAGRLRTVPAIGPPAHPAGRLPTLADGWSAGPTGSSSPCPFSSKPWPVMPWRAFWSRALPCPTAFMTPWPGR